MNRGNQIYHFDGKFKGSFVDEAGNIVDSSNYEILNGFLVIKKFTAADIGLYSEYPTKYIYGRSSNGLPYAVLGPAVSVTVI